MSKPVVLFIELKIASKGRYICDITEKFFLNNIDVDIYARGENAIQLDNLLWTWKQESFIPHTVNTSPAITGEHVVISNSTDNLYPCTTLLLHDPLPIDAIQKYPLIIDFAEIYHSDKKRESRKRFKELRDSGQFDVRFTQLGAILSKESIDINKIQ